MAFSYKHGTVIRATQITSTRELSAVCEECGLTPVYVLAYKVNPSGLPGLAVQCTALSCYRHIHRMMQELAIYAPILVTPFVLESE